MSFRMAESQQTSQATKYSSNNQLLVKIQELTQQNRSLDKQVKSKESEVKKLRQSETHLKSELSSLKQKYDVKIHRNEELEKDLSSAINHTPDAEELLDKLSKAGAQILVLQSDLQTECDKVKLLTAENLSVKNITSCDLYKNVSEPNKTLETLNKNISEEKSYLENFNHDISEKNDILKRENHNLSEKAGKLGDENNELKQAKRQTEREIRKLEQEKRQDERKIHDLKKKLRETDCWIRDYHEELERFRRLSVMDPDEVAELKRQLQSRGNALNAETTSNYELKNQIETLQTQVETLQSQMRTIHRKLADNKDQLLTKSNSIAALKKLLTYTEHNEQRTIAALKMLRLRVDSVKMDDLNQQLKGKLELQQIEKLRSVVYMKRTSESVHYEQFLESIRELESKIEELKQHFEKNAILLVAQNEEINHQQFVAGFTKNSLTKQEETLKTLEIEVKAKDEKLKIFENVITKKNEKLKELEEQLGESAALPQIQKEEIAVLKLKLIRHKTEIAEKNSKVKKMKDAASRKHEKVKKLKHKASEKATQVKKFERETKEKNGKLEELKKSISSQAAHVKHLQSQLDSRELDISNLKLELDKERNQCKRMIDSTQIQAQNKILQRKEEEVAEADDNIKKFEESLEKCQNYNSEVQDNLQKFPSQVSPEKTAELNQSLETQSPKSKVAKEAVDNFRSRIATLKRKQSATPEPHSREEDEFCDETLNKKARE